MEKETILQAMVEVWKEANEKGDEYRFPMKFAMMALASKLGLGYAYDKCISAIIMANLPETLPKESAKEETEAVEAIVVDITESLNEEVEKIEDCKDDSACDEPRCPSYHKYD